MTERYLPWDWYPAPLPENVVLGARSWVYSAWGFRHHHSEQPDAVVVGDDSGVYVGTDFLTGPLARIRIGRLCTINGASFVTDGTISIGDYTFVSYEVTFADDPVAVPPDVASTGTGLTTEIGDSVWIGARVTILGGSHVGEGSVIGAGSVVDGEIPPFVIAAGIPARPLASVPR